MLGGERKNGVVRTSWENWGSKQQKKYERSQYVIENTGKHVQNELKRTQNEPQLSAEMRALRLEFELSNDSQPDGITVTSSRLDKLGTSIGADLNSGRVAASYPRIVAFWRTTLIPHPFWGKLK